MIRFHRHAKRLLIVGTYYFLAVTESPSLARHSRNCPESRISAGLAARVTNRFAW